MSEQILLSGIFTVLGVVIGFLLSQLTDLVKNKGRKSIVKKALSNELSIVRKTLSEALKKKDKRIPDERVPFIVENYDSVRTELASFMKPDSLAVIQRAYEEIKKMNLEGRGHIVIAGSLDHIYQFTDFNKLITLIDESISQLR